MSCRLLLLLLLLLHLMQLMQLLGRLFQLDVIAATAVVVAVLLLLLVVVVVMMKMILLFDSSGRRSRHCRRGCSQRFRVKTRRWKEMILFFDIGRIMLLVLLILLLQMMMVAIVMVMVIRGTDQDVSLIVIGEVGVMIVLAHFRCRRRLVVFIRSGRSSSRRGQHLVSSVIGRHDDRMVVMAICRDW